MRAWQWNPADRIAASRAAHIEAARASKGSKGLDGWPTTVDRVSAVVKAGIVSGIQSNTGVACNSGTLAVITLIGTFPSITVGGAPGQGSHVVHGVTITTDPGSIGVCLLSVQTGDVQPARGAIDLFRR
jgi:hypothetical protein